MRICAYAREIRGGNYEHNRDTLQACSCVHTICSTQVQVFSKRFLMDTGFQRHVSHIMRHAYSYKRTVAHSDLKSGSTRLWINKRNSFRFPAKHAPPTPPSPVLRPTSDADRMKLTKYDYEEGKVRNRDLYGNISIAKIRLPRRR